MIKGLFLGLLLTMAAGTCAVQASYMGVPGIEAEHVTLVLENASLREPKSNCCAIAILTAI